jgi:hypothetical protein
MNERQLAKVQGAFYLGAGLWPLLHRRSFLAVTGPKTDWWLVQTVGFLVTCIGAQLYSSSRSAESARELKVLAGTCAASLAGVEIYYVAKRTIRPVYLLDAVGELCLALGWARQQSKH